MTKKISILILSVFSIGLLAVAHEYVLIANNFILKKGDTLELHLFVADGFNIELERPMQDKMTKKFELISENGKKDLKNLTKDGDFPLLRMKVDFEGLGLIHLERDYAHITLPNEKFKRYLHNDNIENIVIDDSTKTEQSERYSRYIKTLIRSNPKQNDLIYKTEIGHTFEIVLLDNPYKLKVGNWISAKVMFRGKALPNKAITARNRIGGESATYQYARTDPEGICSFKIERAGEWFIHATHMIPCPERDKADWESFWAAFSFEIIENKN